MATKPTKSNRSKRNTSKQTGKQSAAKSKATVDQVKAKATDAVEDAVVVKDATSDAPAKAAAAADAKPAPAAKPTTSSAVPKTAKAEDAPKPAATPPSRPNRTPDPKPAPQPKRRGGAVPLIFGGLIAGGIGYGAATYLPEYMGTASNSDDALNALQQSDADLATQVETLRSELADVAARPQSPDLSEPLDGLGAQLTAVQDQLGGISTDVAGLSDRIALLEKRPMNDAVSPEAVAAYEAELARLREDVTAQSAELATVAATAKSEIQAALDAAAAQEAKAVEITQRGNQQAAAARVQAALAAGASYGEPLAELAGAGVAVPDVLAANAETGVVTVVALQDQFPDLARAALAAARSSEGPAEGESGLSSFFKSQLGVRSLAPQDGDGPDAVLSRAQFAVTETRIADALSELETLPDAAKAVFADWKSQADTRTAALAAADALSASLAQN